MGTKNLNVIDGLVAQRVRAHRMRIGLSQSQLGEKLGVTFQQIQKYEKGVNRVGAGRLFEMARVFDVSVQALFPNSEEVVQSEEQTAESRVVSDFVSSAEGWRLCQAFRQIEDPELRRQIVALVQELAAK
jgi:transcriptional regulator with XRE-family HTH domain